MLTLFVRLCGIFAVCALISLVPVQAQTPRPAFVTGADLSELPYYESQGIKYAADGKETDLLAIAKRSGWKVIRVRLWVHSSPSRPPVRSSSMRR